MVVIIATPIISICLTYFPFSPFQKELPFSLFSIITFLFTHPIPPTPTPTPTLDYPTLEPLDPWTLLPIILPP